MSETSKTAKIILVLYWAIPAGTKTFTKYLKNVDNKRLILVESVSLKGVD